MSLDRSPIVTQVLQTSKGIVHYNSSSIASNMLFVIQTGHYWAFDPERVMKTVSIVNVVGVKQGILVYKCHRTKSIAM